MTEKMNEEDYKNLAFKKCNDNHIWLNKMTYIIPSDEDKIRLADLILEKLRTKTTQIPAEGITSDSDHMRELAELTPVLFLKVNWS